MIMCNEKQRSTWIHHILGLFLDKWLAAWGVRKHNDDDDCFLPTGALCIMMRCYRSDKPNWLIFSQVNATVSKQSLKSNSTYPGQ